MARRVHCGVHELHAESTALRGCWHVEVYGRGKSEKLVGAFQKSTGTNVKVATKFAPLPWRFGQDAPVKALKVGQSKETLPAHFMLLLLFKIGEMLLENLPMKDTILL